MLLWEEFPRVGLAFMDKDHQECLELLGTIEDTFSKHTDNTQQLHSQLDGNLAALYQHLVEHFAREEQAMEETCFPPYYVHKTEHQSVLQQLQGEIAEWQRVRNMEALRRYILRNFVNWLETHALTMDAVTAQHINHHG
ncbi:MAG: hemerythrin family protein [Pseudomonadales bacterium]|nr:hemerythrin family protein [Pseudomonadales bacterium]